MSYSSRHFNVDKIIAGLLGCLPGKEAQLSEDDLIGLCVRSKTIFLERPMLLELEAPVKIVGDVHGQYYDLLRIFQVGGHPPETNYLFLGDYVDRGTNSLDTIALLLAYKIKYPENFHLLRGNHECASINRLYGFLDECKRRYTVHVWETFQDCFDCLPVAAIIGKKIFCCHGGLSPNLQSMDQIRSITRPAAVPAQGFMRDLLWSDPSREVRLWANNEVRGSSFTFGARVVEKFLAKHNFDLIVRAHQCVEDGYEFFADRKLVTIFSAPNYCQSENVGAIMSVDRFYRCDFKLIKLTSSSIIRPVGN